MKIHNEIEIYFGLSQRHQQIVERLERDRNIMTFGTCIKSNKPIILFFIHYNFYFINFTCKLGLELSIEIIYYHGVFATQKALPRLGRDVLRVRYGVVVALKRTLVIGLFQNAIQVFVEHAQKRTHELLCIVLLVAAEIGELVANEVTQLTWRHIFIVGRPHLSHEHGKAYGHSTV